MFGINKKKYYIIASISLGIGIVVFIINILGVFKLDKSILTLTGFIFTLLSFSLFLKPIAKRMKILTEIFQKYRSDLYTAITKDCSKNKIDITCVNFEEWEKKLRFISKKSKDIFVLDGLTIEEALYVVKKLLEDFVKIVYGESVDKKSKITKAKVEFFVVNIKLNDNEYSYKLIDNYLFV